MHEMLSRVYINPFSWVASLNGKPGMLAYFKRSRAFIGQSLILLNSNICPSIAKCSIFGLRPQRFCLPHNHKHQKLNTEIISTHQCTGRSLHLRSSFQCWQRSVTIGSAESGHGLVTVLTSHGSRCATWN